MSTPIENNTAGLEEILRTVNELPNAGGGLTTAQINALDGLFKIAAYTEDASKAYAAFQSAFGLSGGGEEPDVPVVKTYTITAELVNVTSSNKITAVNENASYSTTLTAADGYKLDSVTVTMGGVDITATAYADGVVTIAAVTGNVEIVASASVAAAEAELPTDGLLAYFDLRNKAQEKVGGAYGVATATAGTGSLYDWSSGAGFRSSDNYGIDPERANIWFDKTGGTTTTNLGQNATIVVMSYGKKNCGTWSTFAKGTNLYAVSVESKYKKTDGSTSNGQSVEHGSGSTDKYHYCAISISESEFKVYYDGECVRTVTAASLDGFASWQDAAGICSMWNNCKLTAAAFYQKTLSQAEIVEASAFMKTLEVTA